MITFSLRIEKEIINYYKILALKENKNVSELIRDSISRDIGVDLYDNLISDDSNLIYKSYLESNITDNE